MARNQKNFRHPANGEDSIFATQKAVSAHTETMIVANLLELPRLHAALGSLALVLLVMEVNGRSLVNRLLNNPHLLREVPRRILRVIRKTDPTVPLLMAPAAKHHQVDGKMCPALSDCPSVVNMQIPPMAA